MRDALACLREFVAWRVLDAAGFQVASCLAPSSWQVLPVEQCTLLRLREIWRFSMLKNVHGCS